MASGFFSSACPPLRCRAAGWHWVLLASVALLPLSAPAAETPTQKTTTADGQVRPELRNSSEEDNFWWADRLDRVRFTTPNASYYFVRDPQLAVTYWFFPPMPPPLDGEIPLFGSLLANGPPAPPELTAYINELFYPFLGSWLINDELPKSLRAQLENYRTAKAALQDELRRQLAELKDTTPEARERALTLLANSQAPKIASLDESAEKLRLELRRTLPRGPRSEAPAFPAGAVKVGDSEYSDSLSLQLEADATLFAAFYQDGLEPTQRRLLREAAYQLVLEARATPATANVRWVYFFPETSRFRLPANLPAPLEKILADYVTLKRGLKDELRDTLRDRALSAGARTEKLKRLSADQAPRLVALEALAEEIRRGLAALPEQERNSAAPNLPPELATRISNYRRQKDESLKTLHALLAGNPAEGGRKATVAEFNRTQNTLVAGLNAENAAIRAALAEHMQSSGQPDDSKSVDDLLKEFENARQQQEVRTKFRDYQAAMLLPGLTPGQRRLLFDAAVGQLGLPLPVGQRKR